LNDISLTGKLKDIVMKNTKNWVIIACLIGAAVLIIFTNTTLLNKMLVIGVALVGSGIIYKSMLK